jgi:hypothetical protein
MAGRIAAVRRAQLAQATDTSRLTELNFLARTRNRRTAPTPEEDFLSQPRGQATEAEETAARRIQAVQRGLLTRQQTRRVRRALSRIVLHSAAQEAPQEAQMLAGAFGGWAKHARSQARGR